MEIIIRSIIMFFILFLIVKLLGKKQIKNLTLYDYVLSITIGSIAADSIISLDTPLYDGIIALVIFGAIGYIVSMITAKNHDVEELIDGKPIVLFENGNFNYQNLETAKLSVAKVLENCRLKNCFDINDLDCAILETSGDISVLLKEDAQPVSSKDLKKTMQSNTPKQTLSYEIIVDGDLNEEDLEKSGKDHKWLDKYLKDNKVKTEDVGLLSLDKNDNITLLEKN